MRGIADTLNQVSDRLVSRDSLDMHLLEQRFYIDTRFLEERVRFEETLSNANQRVQEGVSRLEYTINIRFLMFGLGFTAPIIPTLKAFFR